MPRPKMTSAERNAASPRTTTKHEDDVASSHNPEGWVEKLGREPDQDEAAWLKGFFVSHSGNLTRQGFLTDNETAGGISLPFRVNVFRRRDCPEDQQWAYGVVLNPPSHGQKGDPKDQDYSDRNYPDPFTACLAVQTDLEKGGFVISKEALLVSTLRHRFRRHAKQQREEA